MIDKDKISELRRLEAEAKDDGDRMSEANYALFIAMRNALPELLKALETPVAWRWKPVSSSIWIYDPSEDWVSDHWDDPDIDLEPLFVLPPHGGVDVG